jgi:hypothetical protein
MPLLSDPEVKTLLELAAIPSPVQWLYSCKCVGRTARDYCRTCDEFYWVHAPGCPMHEDKHHGHRLTIVPFVEERL